MFLLTMFLPNAKTAGVVMSLSNGGASNLSAVEQSFTRTILSSGRAVLLAIAVALLCTSASADEQDTWREYREGAYSAKIGALLQVYGVAPTYLSSMRFRGIQETIGDVLLFRASDNASCASNQSCYYILISSDSGEAPFVTRCEFQQGSLTHHFHPDRSNFFVFDFRCSGAAMQIQVSKGHFLIAAGPSR
jgi:hypothetical protein